MRHADLLIHSITVVTMDDQMRILNSSAVAIVDGIIVDIGDSVALQSEYEAQQVIDGSGRILYPGFISTHTHLFQTFLKGLGRDKTLFEWIDASIFPVLKHFDSQAIHQGALVGLIEALRTGTTTVADYQYCHVRENLDEAVIAAYEALGVRCVLFSSYVDISRFPEDKKPQYRENIDDYFSHIERLCKKYTGNPMVRIGMAPSIVWDLNRDEFIRMRAMANSLSIPISMHCVENEADDAYCQETYAMGTVEFLDSCGILGPDFLAVHMVCPSEEDVLLLQERGVTVSHCPISNMVLASGAAPVPQMLSLGIPVSLACDGAASNDSQDMLEVMKATAMLHKLVKRDASVISARDVLWMATRGGAKALGLDAEIGSIEIGKRADFFIWQPIDCRSIPVHDPISNLIYASGRANIETTIINGKPVILNGELVGQDEQDILQKAQQIATELVHKAGL
jgi:5-methylthioadenosine/S-adenosylhomocysteine deaminase